MPYDAARHGPVRLVGPGFHARVYAAARRIPPGRVATYGDLAALIGSRSIARQVGFALAALPAARQDVPWHRVVSAGGWLLLACREQRRRLRQEGVRLTPQGRIQDFARLRCPLAGEPA